MARCSGIVRPFDPSGVLSKRENVTPLTLHTSNRLENLMDALADTVRAPLSDPFAQETILIQSRGMEHWISMGIADRLGVCSNVRFPFPNAFLESLFQALSPEVPEGLPYDVGPLTFRIYALLSDLKAYRRTPLGLYLQDDPDGLKRYQLASRIADRFDQYQIYRPGLIAGWDSGEAGGSATEVWQRRLWQGIGERINLPHRTARSRMLIDSLSAGDVPEKRLPERLSVFGISYLPPLFFELLTALAQCIPVHLFFLSPTREFWGDILTERDRRRILNRHRDATEADLHLEPGNPLLASMGRMGRAFFSLAAATDCDFVDHFEDPGDSHLLQRIQTDILYLRTPDPDDFEVSPPAEPDMSIQFHACHSPLREIEVLHDQLTALFERCPDLDPSDVLVLTPDIETYAPFIQAVFDAEPDRNRRIPYAIADRGFQNEFRLAEEFMGFLELKDARMTLTQVMGLLDSEGVRRRYDLDEADLEHVRGWLETARVRWGVDAADRRRMGLPATAENTWQNGIDRLVLGYAMAPVSEADPVEGLYPAESAEGSEAVVLGRFLDFLEDLFAFRDHIRASRPLKEWSDFLKDILDRFWQFPDEAASVTQRIRGFLDELENFQTVSDCSEPIALEVVRAHLTGRMKADRRPGGFISGRTTFCAMLPMRSIPAQVICLIGMDGDRFPREDRLPRFDLMARDPKPGDRSSRDDDRYLFLEALLSARRCFYVSYVGQGIRDNADLPPSVLVSELLDHLRDGYDIPSNRLVVRHPLHAWSPAYFDGNSAALFSFSNRDFEAARRLAAARLRPEPIDAFCQQALTAPEGDRQILPIESLCQFYANPCRFFLQQRLGIFYPVGRQTEDREPFSLDALERFTLGSTLTTSAAVRVDPDNRLDRSRGEGMLPHGQPGQQDFFTIYREAERLNASVQKLAGAPEMAPIEVSLRLGEWTLNGSLEALRPGGLAMVRYAKLRPAALLSAWIHHLVLCAVELEAASKQTFLIHREGAVHFSYIAEPEFHLIRLVEGLFDGMRAPLPLYPLTSWEFARRTLLKAEPQAKALAKASEWMAGNRFRSGDLDDPYVALCLRGRDGLDRVFQETAIRLYGPLFKHSSGIN